MAENTSKKNTKIIIIAAAVIIVVLVGAVVVLATKINSNKNDVGSAEETTATTREVLINEDNAESVAESLFAEEEEQEHLPVSHFMTDMNTVWHFPDGKSESTDAYVGNIRFNSTDIYFDVARKDNGEVIYASPVIPLDSAIENFKLDTDLDAGTYPCVLTYTLIDENQTPISTLNVAVDVIIEK